MESTASFHFPFQVSARGVGVGGVWEAGQCNVNDVCAEVNAE